MSDRSWLAVLLALSCRAPASPAGDAGAAAPVGSLHSSAHGDLAVPGRILALPEFALSPGQEVTQCWYVPPDGADHFVHAFRIHASPGSHHLIALRVHDVVAHPATGPSECLIPWSDSADYHVDGALPGSVELETSLVLPDGVAIPLSKNSGLYFQSHYVNATPTPIIASISYAMDGIDPADVAQQAGVLTYSNTDLDLPPGRSSATKSCLAPADFKLVFASAHVHEHATHFRSSVNGQSLFEADPSTGTVGLAFAPPGFDVAMGDAIVWTCDYDNTTGGQLHYGTSAVRDEMCILGGIFYPVGPAGQVLSECFQ